jgi:hypothetical protein
MASNSRVSKTSVRVYTGRLQSDRLSSVPTDVVGQRSQLQLQPVYLMYELILLH